MVMYKEIFVHMKYENFSSMTFSIYGKNWQQLMLLGHMQALIEKHFHSFHICLFL